MRKRYRTTIIALLMVLTVCPLGAAATAGPVDMESRETVENSDESKGENIEKISLQIPQKLQVTIDPFELDGKGQIYSEQYTIWNVGETTGTLTLSFTCTTQGVEIKREKGGIHDGEGKAVYMEIEIGETDRMILSSEGSEYCAELKPGEGLSLRFTGEINENTPDSWKDGDIAVEGIYKWDIPEETLPEKLLTEEHELTGKEITESRESVSAGEVVPNEENYDVGESMDSETMGILEESGDSEGAGELETSQEQRESSDTEEYSGEDGPSKGEASGTGEPLDERSLSEETSREEG